MVFWGIFSGILAAAGQSGGYILSRIYLKQGGKAIVLAVATQIWMSLLSIPMILLSWFPDFWGDWHWSKFAAMAAIGTTGGEIMFFMAEKSIAPSRLSSLLGLRVAVLMVAAYLLGLEKFSILQIGAVVLAAASAMVMNYQNGGINWHGMGWVFGALGFYCMSDLSVKLLIDGMNAPSFWQRALLAAGMLNMLLLPLAAALYRYLKLKLSDMRATGAYAVSWFGKQACLYSCYALVGPVFGNVIMASRGPLTVIMTLILLHFGVQNLEKNKSRTVWIRRGTATLMMTAAIILYSCG